ncbi:MAG: hypothetical protein U5K99_09310 [Anaerolineales bacterium]|nr:hypothetical protein [Anaerolineales bacterium]
MSRRGQRRPQLRFWVGDGKRGETLPAGWTTDREMEGQGDGERARQRLTAAREDGGYDLSGREIAAGVRHSR